MEPTVAKGHTQRRSASGTAGRKPTRQRFHVSHHDEASFKSEGLRSYARYRDFGFRDATNGLVQAHVIRLVPPCDPHVVSKRHYHDVEFQMIYVLKGWIRTEFDGQGEIVFHEGSTWIQPPGIRHTVLDYGDDCELLEVVLPADFDTVEVEDLPDGQSHERTERGR